MKYEFKVKELARASRLLIYLAFGPPSLHDVGFGLSQSVSTRYLVAFLFSFFLLARPTCTRPNPINHQNKNAGGGGGTR